ncbi:mitochondrial carrier domain-containing protein [Lanmaoa asiatica]|nr:mitochondrial carrier domain-containing protein [Lanmaoa asiatica]
MSTAQDVIDLTISPSVPSAPLTFRGLLHHRTPSPAHEAPSGSDRQRQKRRRVDVDSDVEFVTADPGVDVDQSQSEVQQPADTSQPSSILTHISTWEIPPDVVANYKPHPIGEDSPQVSLGPVLADQPIASSFSYTAPIYLSDSDEPIVISPKADSISSGAAPIVIPDKSHSPSPLPPSTSTPTVSTSEALSAYTCPICFSPPTNATLTPCGHICCGQCLFTAVKSIIRRNMVVAMDRAPAARCPVCRAEIPGWDGRGGGVIGLKMQVLIPSPRLPHLDVRTTHSHVNICVSGSTGSFGALAIAFSNLVRTTILGWRSRRLLQQCRSISAGRVCRAILNSTPDTTDLISTAQKHGYKATSSTAKGKRKDELTMLSVLLDIFKHEEYAYFFFYSFLRTSYIKRLTARAPAGSKAPVLSTAAELSLGAAAGALSQIFTIPVSVIATRQQVGRSSRAQTPSESANPRDDDDDDDSLLGVAREIIREEGVTGLWLGIKPGMVLTVNPAITYGVYERLKSILLLARTASGAADKLTPGISFLLGAFSKTLATIVTYPYIMAKVRIQARTSEHDAKEENVLPHSSRPPAKAKQSGALGLLIRVLETEGFVGWYQGMSAQIIKAVLSQALLFVSKEQFERWALALMILFSKLSAAS